MITTEPSASLVSEVSWVATTVCGDYGETGGWVVEVGSVERGRC